MKLQNTHSHFISFTQEYKCRLYHVVIIYIDFTGNKVCCVVEMDIICPIRAQQILATWPSPTSPEPLFSSPQTPRRRGHPCPPSPWSCLPGHNHKHTTINVGGFIKNVKNVDDLHRWPTHDTLLRWRGDDAAVEGLLDGQLLI